MPADVLIVGQGLAGTVLAWHLGRAGISWHIVDAGHETAASRVAAGIVNPVTGLRWVKSWRVDACLPLARSCYREMAEDLDRPLWRDVAIRRFWRTERERRALEAKIARGVLAGYVTMADAGSALIRPAGRLDVPALLEAARNRWRAAGRLTEGRVDWNDLPRGYGAIIDCTGAAARRGPFAARDFAVSKGEVLRVAWAPSDRDTILHAGDWLLPVAAGESWIGATHEPGRDDLATSDAARTRLLASARRLTGRDLAVTGQMAGLRLAAPGRRPLAGRLAPDSPIGLLGALGSKGVLYAPWLAQQWVAHLRDGAPFEADAAGAEAAGD